MKFSKFVVGMSSLIVAGILFTPSAKAADQKWDFNHIETVASQIHAQIYAGRFEGDDMAVLSRLLHSIDQLASQMSHNEHRIDGMFQNKKAPRLESLGAHDVLRELYDREYVLQNQVHSIHGIMNLAQELSAGMAGKSGEALRHAIGDVAELGHKKQQKLSDLRELIAKIENNGHELDEEAARALRERMNFD